MARLYAAAFLAPSPAERPLPPRPSECAQAFHTVARNSSFPYDVGDDPAFFSARFNDGPVTWGVCRADVRCAIRAGDWMVFFSSERYKRSNNGFSHYRFVAALCVETKLPQTALFVSSRGIAFSTYLNLLIRPNGEGWEHFEPALHPSLKEPFKWHADWSWRLCCRRQGLRKAEIVAAGLQHVKGQPLTFGGNLLSVADNYVVFSRILSIIAEDPPLVATYRTGDARERWETDRRSKRIRELIFAGAGRGLRTGNRQQPHRHFVRELDDANWLTALRETLMGN